MDRIEYPAADTAVLKNRILDSALPLIMSGVPLPSAEIFEAQYLRSHFMNPGQRGLGWYNTHLPEVGEDLFNTPDLVREILTDPETIVRPNPVRIWMQPGGHRTLMHYDGNSICGLNLQVAGRKHWTLISPRTPIPCASFNKVAAIDQSAPYDPDRYSVIEFETVPGDLLYLPRYWFHRVEALQPVNINVNWVWTPAVPDLSSPIGRREVELLKLARTFPRLDRFMFDDTVGYGGGSPALVDRYIEDLSTGDAVKRFFLELAAFPRTVVRSRQLLNLLRQFKQNNFNVGQ